MIFSGMRYAVDLPDRADDGILTRFRDAGEISPWAKDEMIDRMLRKIGFIN